MSKFDTMFFENERELSPKNISNLGLNPAALMILVKSYGAKISPQPALCAFHAKKGGVLTTVEIELRTPGYMGRATGAKDGIDTFGLKLLADSYLGSLSPRPISFLYMNAEVHIRTKGVPEDLYPNIARNIFNPTATKSKL